MTRTGEPSARSPTFLTMDLEDLEPILEIGEGPYAGRNSLELLNEGADWAEARLRSAIERAGFSPDEERNIVTFAPKPPTTGTVATLFSDS